MNTLSLEYALLASFEYALFGRPGWGRRGPPRCNYSSNIKVIIGEGEREREGTEKSGKKSKKNGS